MGLRPPAEWRTARTREALIARISARLAEGLPGMGFSFSQPIELRMAELISGTRSDVAITLYGDDLGTLERLSGQIQAVARGVPGAKSTRCRTPAHPPSRAAAARAAVSFRRGRQGALMVGSGERGKGLRRARRHAGP